MRKGRGPQLATTACLLLLGLVVGQSCAETLEVPGSYATIAVALQAAQAGDTVLIACGTYYEVSLSMKAGIVLRSAMGNPACVTIDGQSSGNYIFRCSGLTGDTRIEGITFASGGGAHYSPPYEGGGIRVYTSSLSFTRCNFVENDADDGGGALYCIGSSIELQECFFYRNRADWEMEATANGGAIFASSCSLIMDRCRFEANTSRGEGLGSAMYLSQTTLTATDCEFIGNFNSTGGGSAALYMTNTCTVNLIAPRFEGNWAFFGLGSIAVGAHCQLTVSNGLFIENRGGISADEIGVADDAIASITSSTFIADLSAHYNPLFGVSQPGGILTLTNCLLVLGADDEIGECLWGEAEFQCSNVYSASGPVWVDCYADQLGVNGNISADPQFCGEAGSGNYYLQSDSPCAPANNSCGALIGALPVGCEAVATKASSISAIKSLY